MEDDVLVKVSPSGTDAEDLAELTRLLRDDLLDLDVLAVEPVPSGQDAPEDSKGVLELVAGWLAVNLGPEALRVVVSRVAGWAARNDRTVEVTMAGDVLKLTGVTSQQQDRLIDEWLARQAPGT